MASKFVRATFGLMMAAWCLLAGDQGYSMSNLPKLRTLPVVLDKDADGTCISWSRYWAPQGTIPLDDLVVFRGEGSTPWNRRFWGDFGIRFQINRVVTDDANLDANGFLKDPQSLIAQGVIAPTVTVEFVAIEYFHDRAIVKTWHGEGLTANFKVVSVNDHKFWSEPERGSISGWDWSLPCNHFTTLKIKIPVGMLKFPRKAPVGNSPLPVENQIVVTTDMSGSTHALPAFKVAWVKASVKAMAPIFLVHGTNSSKATWNVPKWDSFNNYFKTFLGICFNDINLEANGGIDSNGLRLEIRIASSLYGVGAKACHIVAHSKGGLDSRSFIKAFYGNGSNQNLGEYGRFEVLSLYTLNTPHRGTVLSDISWNTQNHPDLRADVNWYDLKNLMQMDFGFLHANPPEIPDAEALAPTGHALEAQMTMKMQRWNESHFFDLSKANTGGRPIKFYNTASDADWNNRNLKIDPTENSIGAENDIGAFASQYPFISIATSAYRMLYWAKQVEIRSSSRPVVGKDGNVYAISTVTELYVPDDQRGTQWNDLVVNLGSALYDGGVLFTPNGAPNLNGILFQNHSGVKTFAIAGGIVDQIRSDWPLDH